MPHLRVPADVREEDLTAIPAKPAKKSSLKAVAIAAIVLLAIGGVVAFRLLRSRPAPPPPTPIATKPAAKPPIKPAAAPGPANAVPKPGPTPSATLNQIAAIPGQAVAKAQATVAARRTNEQVRVDALVAGEEPPEKRALNTPPPAKFTPAAPPPTTTTLSTAQVAPGVTATSVSTTEVSGTGSAAFRAWVADARVNGVFQGSPARALINGRTFRVGQQVDDTLGIVFDGVDAENRILKFRDASGAKVSKRY